MTEWNWTMIVGIFLIIQFLFIVYSHCVIKFNDFAHTNRKLDRTNQKLDEINVKVTDISDRVSYLEGREGVTRRVRKNKKKISKKITKQGGKI